MSPSPYHRIVVIGTTGSGKSTLARQLAERLGGDFIELDALYWETNWRPAPFDVFYERVEAATQAERWAAAGNYRAVRELTWLKADTIIWLDYPLLFTFGRLWQRGWRRWWSQEELWNGNYENIWTHFKFWSQESLFHWFFKTYWKRKKEFALLLDQPEYQAKALRFKSQNETSAWLGNLDGLTDHVVGAQRVVEFIETHCAPTLK